MVSRITGKTIHEEVSRITHTFDVVGWIRARRLQWLVHILRMEEKRLVYKALKHIHENKSEGDLLMDMSEKYSWKELIHLTANRDGWKRHVERLKRGEGGSVDDKIRYHPHNGHAFQDTHAGRLQQHHHDHNDTQQAHPD